MGFSKGFVATTSLLCKLLDDTYLNLTGKIKEELKHNINIPDLKIQNSKFIGKPEEKFETLLFLPPNPQRIAEGGLRTKGLFKFSYKLVDNQWHVCDLEGYPLIPAPKEIQEKINEYVNGLEDSDKGAITQLPLITVITVVYNGAKHLEETIKSVLNQTYPNVEYIIIDGGSTDGTLDIIKKYEDKIDYWVSEPDEGIYDAMNKGILTALGKGLLFLNSGDKFLSKNCFNDLKIPAFLYCTYYIRIGNKLLKKVISKPRNYKFGLPVPHQAILFENRRIFYNTSYKLAADYDYFLKHGYNNKLPFIKGSMVFYDNFGISSKEIMVRDKELLKIIKENFSFQHFIWAYIFFAFKRTIKKIIKLLFP